MYTQFAWFASLAIAPWLGPSWH